MRKKLSANISLDIDHHQDEWETGKNVCVCALKVLVHKADFLLYPILMAYLSTSHTG